MLFSAAVTLHNKCPTVLKTMFGNIFHPFKETWLPAQATGVNATEDGKKKNKAEKNPSTSSQGFSRCKCPPAHIITGWKSATLSFPKLPLFQNKGYTQDQVQQWNQPCKQDGKISYSHIQRVIKGKRHMGYVFWLGHGFAIRLSFSLLTYQKKGFQSRRQRWKRKPMNYWIWSPLSPGCLYLRKMC